MVELQLAAHKIKWSGNGETLLAKHGRETELGTDLCIGYATFIDDSEEKAINNARRYFEENMKMFAPLGFVRGLSEAQMAVSYTHLTLPTILLV